MDVYQTVTDAILERLSQGIVPWRKRWTIGTPKSYSTKKEYHGINVLILGSQPHSSRYWVTKAELKRLGGTVEESERQYPVVYWHWRTEEEKEKLIAKGKAKNPAPCVPLISWVYNLDQVSELKRPEDDYFRPEEGEYKSAEALIDSIIDRPTIVHSALMNPSYSPVMDQILMPHIGQFERGDIYYLTLFHELIHSTGHSSRLGRFNERQGERRDEEYSFEELIAEFGGAFLSSIVGLDSSDSIKDSAAYIAGWSKVFREDKHLLLKAAGAAQKAVSYLRGKRDYERYGKKAA